MKEIVLTGKKKRHGRSAGRHRPLCAGPAWAFWPSARSPGGRELSFWCCPSRVLALGWIFLCGLKVLKPQEALVLTLFGKYIGTLKGEGFYYVNPFCTAVNPAAKTQPEPERRTWTAARAASQAALDAANQASRAEAISKKISLKIMTLNNARQKINDCLGNPVEIGIAVMWRVVDTAKAVFDVDNYKEYLSLQCDGALRNIVRIYPYDVAPGIDTTGDGQR